MSKVGREWGCQQVRLVSLHPPVATSSELTWPESVNQCCPRGLFMCLVFTGTASSAWDVKRTQPRSGAATLQLILAQERCHVFSFTG